MRQLTGTRFQELVNLISGAFVLLVFLAACTSSHTQSAPNTSGKAAEEAAKKAGQKKTDDSSLLDPDADGTQPPPKKPPTPTSSKPPVAKTKQDDPLAVDPLIDAPKPDGTHPPPGTPPPPSSNPPPGAAGGSGAPDHHATTATGDPGSLGEFVFGQPKIKVQISQNGTKLHLSMESSDFHATEDSAELSSVIIDAGQLTILSKDNAELCTLNINHINSSLTANDSPAVTNSSGYLSLRAEKTGDPSTEPCLNLSQHLAELAGSDTVRMRLSALKTAPVASGNPSLILQIQLADLQKGFTLAATARPAASGPAGGPVLRPDSADSTRTEDSLGSSHTPQSTNQTTNLTSPSAKVTVTASPSNASNAVDLAIHLEFPDLNPAPATTTPSPVTASGSPPAGQSPRQASGQPVGQTASQPTQLSASVKTIGQGLLVNSSNASICKFDAKNITSTNATNLSMDLNLQALTKSDPCVLALADAGSLSDENHQIHFQLAQVTLADSVTIASLIIKIPQETLAAALQSDSAALLTNLTKSDSGAVTSATAALTAQQLRARSRAVPPTTSDSQYQAGKAALKLVVNISEKGNEIGLILKMNEVRALFNAPTAPFISGQVHISFTQDKSNQDELCALDALISKNENGELDLETGARGSTKKTITADEKCLALAKTLESLKNRGNNLQLHLTSKASANSTPAPAVLVNISFDVFTREYILPLTAEQMTSANAGNLIDDFLNIAPSGPLGQQQSQIQQNSKPTTATIMASTPALDATLLKQAASTAPEAKTGSRTSPLANAFCLNLIVQGDKALSGIGTTIAEVNTKLSIPSSSASTPGPMSDIEKNFSNICLNQTPKPPTFAECTAKIPSGQAGSQTTADIQNWEGIYDKDYILGFCGRPTFKLHYTVDRNDVKATKMYSFPKAKDHEESLKNLDPSI